jgi:hypothetical protein
VTGLNGAEHHHAEMRVDVDGEGRAHLVRDTGYLPHHLAEERAASYDNLSAEVVAAVEGRGSGGRRRAGGPRSRMPP